MSWLMAARIIVQRPFGHCVVIMRKNKKKKKKKKKKREERKKEIRDITQFHPLFVISVIFISQSWSFYDFIKFRLVFAGNLKLKL